MKIVCPTCKRVIENAPEDHPPRPFCSPQCKLADLDNWLNGRYRIPTDEAPEEGDPHDAN
jgi:endogenous inhibitor of DNA gyrase (YacG/DUF329 family)